MPDVPLLHQRSGSVHVHLSDDGMQLYAAVLSGEGIASESRSGKDSHELADAPSSDKDVEQTVAAPPSKRRSSMEPPSAERLRVGQVRVGRTGRATVVRIAGRDGVLVDTEAEGKCVYGYEQVLALFPVVEKRSVVE